jgi:hypothetical protein
VPVKRAVGWRGGTACAALRCGDPRPRPRRWRSRRSNRGRGHSAPSAGCRPCRRGRRRAPGLSRWSSMGPMGPFPLAPSVKSAAAALAAATSSSGPVTSTMRRSKSCFCSQSPSVIPRSVQPRTQRILSANRQAKPPENRPTHQSRQCFACCR